MSEGFPRPVAGHVPVLRLGDVLLAAKGVDVELDSATAYVVTIAILFALCWLGTVILPQGPSHRFVTFFSTAPVGSIACSQRAL